MSTENGGYDRLLFTVLFYFYNSYTSIIYYLQHFLSTHKLHFYKYTKSTLNQNNKIVIHNHDGSGDWQWHNARKASEKFK